MGRIYVIIYCLLMTNSCFSQAPYFDFPGLVIGRTPEQNSVRNFQNQTLKTAPFYATTAGLAALEKRSRSKMNFNFSQSTHVNYGRYERMCRKYINPFSKRKCNNKYNYLKSAHLKVLQLVTIPTKNKVNQGVKEQIREKYTRITNVILRELELLKIQVDKETFFTSFIKP